ncbi:MAG: DUF1641 domain-containing protein [Pirellulales bacterium]
MANAEVNVDDAPDLTVRGMSNDTAVRLAEQIDQLNQRLAKIDRLQDSVEAFAAIACDVLDERIASSVTGGGPGATAADERLNGVLLLLERVTRHDSLKALTALAEQAPQFERAATLLAEMPDFVATLVDVMDDWAHRCGNDGVDLVQTLRNGLRLAIWLGQRVDEVDLERLGRFLRSDVMDPHSLEVVGNAATALVACQRDVCGADRPSRAGVLSLIQAIRDPRTQQSLAFAIQFSKAFGELTGKSCRRAGDNQENR